MLLLAYGRIIFCLIYFLAQYPACEELCLQLILQIRNLPKCELIQGLYNPGCFFLMSLGFSCRSLWGLWGNQLGKHLAHSVLSLCQNNTLLLKIQQLYVAENSKL